MGYSMEELLPIVGRLAEKYTAFESTSIPYEKVEQLLEAVLYCIRAAERIQTEAPLPMKGVSAWQAYKIGAAMVKEKTRTALVQYHEILQEFNCFGNRCLYETLIKGMPEFFRRYDAEFAPQHTVLMLDYPLLCDLSEKTGIDRITEFLECIRMEQLFLKGFPEGAVKRILSRYHSNYEDLVENICELVLMVFAANVLTETPAGRQRIAKRGREQDMREEMENIKMRQENEVALFVQKKCDGSDCLMEYLRGALEGILFRMEPAVTYRMLTCMRSVPIKPPC